MTQNDYFKYLNVGLPDDILSAKLAGDLDKAIRLIDKRLSSTEITETLKYSLLAQKEIIKRIPDSFTVPFCKAYERIKKEIPDFTQDELQEYLDERRLEWTYINKEVYLVHSFFGTLSNYPDFKKRLPNYKETKIEDTHVYKTVKEIKEKGYQEHEITIRHSIKLDDEHFKPGMKLLVHLPIPRVQDTQKMVRIDSFYPDCGKVDKEDALQRTISFEKVMDKNEEFYVEYTYTNRYDYVDLEGKKGIASDDYKEYTKEVYPNIVFTPFIKALCEELTANLDDPLAKAKAIYDYITKNMKYAFQKDYFLMDNIPARCARNHRGDCGVFALLFITLCRCAGIPAHWESCFAAEPDDAGCHDWARFYVKPFGWLFADPSFGVGANRIGNEEGRKYYFGHLDAYRMVANSQVDTDFGVNKQFFRADPVDNQRGEIESSERGFKFDERSSDRKIVKFVRK